MIHASFKGKRIAYIQYDQALLAQAMEAVPEEYARIFGEQNEDGTWKNASYEKQFMKSEEFDHKTSTYDSAAGGYVNQILKLTRQVKSSETVSAGDYAAYLKQLEELGGNDDERMYVTGNGLFNEHVGVAPVMKSDADPTVALENYWKNVRFDGTGETGRIMGLYIQHRMIEGAGFAEASQPGYNLRLWDDRGSWMKAPTIRTVTDIGVTALAAVVVAGPMGAAAISLIDDAVFTVLDVSNGMDATDAFGSLGKKALSSMVSSRISFAFSSGGGLLSSTMLGDNLIGKTLTKGIELSAINMTSSAINSVDVRGIVSGNDMFNEQAFIEGTFGKTAMTSVMSGMANSYVSNALGDFNLKTESGTYFTGSSGAVNVNALKTFNQTMGGLASTAVTYGMTGNASVNLLNMNMFGGPSVGLFELGFGKNGLSGAVSMGGTDLSARTLFNSFTGLHQTARIGQLKNGDEADVATLETIAAFDNTNSGLNYKLARELFNGSTKLEIGSGVSANGTVYNGMYSSDKTDTLTISKALLGDMTQEDYAKIASTVSHEGSHMNGVNVEGVAHMYGADTYSQLVQNLGLKGDADFAGSIASALADDASWTENSGGEQYWKFNLDGTIEDTTDKAFYRQYIDENGVAQYEKIKGSEYTGSRAKALVEAIGKENVIKMLGTSVNSMSDVPAEIIASVTGCTIEDARRMKIYPSMGINLLASDSTRFNIIGEMLLNDNGVVWNSAEKKWMGGSLKIPGLEKNDSLGVNRNTDGTYEFFSAGFTFSRDDDAYDVYKDVETSSYDVFDNTNVTIWKKNLFTNTTISETLNGAWTSVSHHSNDTTTKKIDNHQYKGATIVSEYFKMHLTAATQDNQDDWGIDTVGVITDAVTLDGKKIDKYGKLYGQSNDWSRWLIHSMSQNGGSAGCFGPMSDNGINNYSSGSNGTGSYYMTQLLSKLQNQWSIYKGYEFNMYMQGKLRP